MLVGVPRSSDKRQVREMNALTILLSRDDVSCHVGIIAVYSVVIVLTIYV